MTTAADIITDAHLFAGIGDVYNPVDANNGAMALRFLNNLLDSVSNEEYSVFDTIDQTLPLVNGTQTYTVGPGNLGTPATRPSLISALYILDTNSISHPVMQIGSQQWADIVYKPAPGRPEQCWVNYNALTVDLMLYPNPAFAGDILHIINYAVLQAFTTQAGVLTAPPGYTMWLVTALARLLSAVNQKQLSPDKERIAEEARRLMRAQNRDINILGLDLPTGERTVFNIFTGNLNGG